MISVALQRYRVDAVVAAARAFRLLPGIRSDVRIGGFRKHIVFHLQLFQGRSSQISTAVTGSEMKWTRLRDLAFK